MTSEETPLLSRTDDMGQPYPRNARNWTLVAIGLAELTILIVMTLRKPIWTETADVRLSSLIPLTVWLYAALLPLIRPSLLPYYSLLTIYILNMLGSVVDLFVSALRADPESLPGPALVPNPLRFNLLAIFHICLFFLGTALVLGTPTRVTSGPPMKNSDGQNPALDEWATVWQWATFTWVDPLITQGKKMALEESDVWQLARNLRARVVLKKFSGVRGTSFMWRLLKANARDLFVTAVLILINGIAHAATATTLPMAPGSQNPVAFLNVLVADPGLENHYLQMKEESSASRGRRDAYLWTLVAFVLQLVRCELDLQNSYTGRRAILRAKTMSIGTIYEKALKRIDTSGAVGSGGDKIGADSQPTAGSADMGKIASLISTDTDRLRFFILVYQILVQSPLSIILAALFLYRLMGWSAFLGYIAIFIAIPANTLILKWQFKMYTRTMEMRDVRMRVMNEAIQSIKFIKFSAWETRWIDRIMEQRNAELKTTIENRFAIFFLDFVWNVIPIVVASVSLSSFTYFAGHQLSIPIAFPALLTFQILTDELTSLPAVFSFINLVYGSVERIGDFLDEREVPAEVTSLLPGYDDRPFNELIGCQGATFVWNITAVTPEKRLAKEMLKKAEEARKKRSWRDTLTLRTIRRKPQEISDATPSITTSGASITEQFRLRNINIVFPRGSMTLIYGPTASGKSSLLSAILGEMECLEGTVYLPKFPNHIDRQTGLKEAISFCAQHPWLENKTIRDNILFGTPYARDRYNMVLSACALIPDLNFLEGGDMTEIGDKGITLSGGQKARVALARSIYAYTKTVVLDDVLSAVDAPTAAILIKRCLLGPLMNGRTLILVTHHVEAVINHCSYVVRMSNGTIDLQGPVNDLRTSGELPEGKDAKLGIEEEDSNHDDLAEVAGKDVEDTKKLNDKETKNSDIRAVGAWVIVLLVASIFAQRNMDLLQKIWIKIWSESYEDAPSQPKEGPVKTSFGFPSATSNPLPYVFVYIGIQSLNALLRVVAQLPSIFSTIRAARTLFRAMLESVVRSPARWFDKTPAGRILSRFSVDIDHVDDGLSMDITALFEQSMSMAIAIATVTYGVPPFLIAAVVILYLHYLVASGYVSASRDLNRIQNTLRSPVLSTFGELLRGVATVRAFGAERRLLQTMAEHLDRFQATYYYNGMANFLLRFRFNVLGGITFFIATLFAIMFGLSAGLAAIVIMQAQSMLGTIYTLMRSYVDTENAFNSVERIQEYIDLPPEPPLTIEGSRPPKDWPSSRGGIKFDRTVIKYASDLDPVLRGVSFEIRPNEQVGIVGRTGSGKSTLALSLFRFVDPTEGKIEIDGISITDIGVEDLRSRLTLIPQDAVLFKGSLRENLDPFNEYTDAECYSALRSVQLLRNEPDAEGADQSAIAILVHNSGLSGDSTSAPEAASVVITLNSAVSEGGNNWSAGQRQLIALARALLRKTKITVLDESTASVDFETDRKIQHAIREGFRGGIMLIIAHRLCTVIECDRILVLEEGKVVEFDTPAKLIDNDGGTFHDMCIKSEDFETLHKSAHRT
ncbi:P-loop containing nucleoside triphosphate hydrolase protein [Auriculariales sp. MPI-PUGE-AT-0066]|nr:P-loop containing nucleoside triphosphate hydrolase protein [Auriculariales sp. MPI-PUGE-AT-0066]